MSRFKIKSAKTRVALFFSMAVTLLVILPAGANAMEWENGYGASLTLGHDDNYRLDEEDEIDTSTADIGVFTELTGTTEISSVGLAAGADVERFSDSSIDDAESYYLSLDADRTGERLTSSIALGYASELITTTELLDTGFTEEDGSRDSISVRPGLSYRFDERNIASVNLGFEDVSYDTDSLTDFTDTSASLSWRYLIDENSSVSTTLAATVYDPDDDDDTDTTSMSVGYEWRTSAVTQLNLSVGYTDVDRPRDDEDGGNFSFGIDHETNERNRFNLAVSRSYEASGGDEVREEDRLSLGWFHALSDRTQATVTSEGVSTDDRDYYEIALGCNYQYTREVRLGASYRYRERDEDVEDEDADSNTILFSIFYTPV